MAPGEWFLVSLPLLAASCGIAQAAGSYTGAWAWGLLGPVGWLVAVGRGVQVRLGDRELSPAGGRDHEDEALVECGNCGARLELFPNPGASTECPECSAPIADHTRRNPRL
jgi:hypothetical protein